MFADQINNNKILQVLYYFVFFSLLLTFNDWFNKEYFTAKSVENFTAVCWPHFKECTSLYIFNAVPEGYSLGILYACLGLFLFVSLFFSLQGNWRTSLVFLIPPVIFKFFGLYFFSYLPTANYTVLEVLIAFALIFSKNKIFAAKVILTLFYASSIIIKLHEGYFSGNVFKSLSLGVPILPDIFLPYYGILFIVLVGISLIFLWSSHKDIRNIAVVTLFCFHIYSIILVGFRYPLLCISLIFLLFVFSENERFLLVRVFKDKFLVVVTIFVITMQLIPIFIKGDVKITSEGQKYGFYMFDANRQCISKQNIFYKNGDNQETIYKNTQGMFRCDPYQEWFKAYLKCKNLQVAKISWSFDISINGSSYYTLVQTNNACALNFRPFQHNMWIKEGVKNNELEVYKNSI